MIMSWSQKRQRERDDDDGLVESHRKHYATSDSRSKILHKEILIKYFEDFSCAARMVEMGYVDLDNSTSRSFPNCVQIFPSRPMMTMFLFAFEYTSFFLPITTLDITFTRIFFLQILNIRNRQNGRFPIQFQ